MFSLINTSIAILWLISAVIDYANFCYVWQLKWYRWDRIRDFLSTIQGKKFLFRYDFVYRVPIAILLFFWPINDSLFLKKLIVFFLLFDVLIRVYKYYKKENRRPIFSLKASIIILTSIGIEALWVFSSRDLDVLIFALLIRLLIISFVVVSFNTFTNLFKHYYFFRAEKKLKQYKNLKVIGITGSYGKTTVKELLYQMLSSKFEVIKTPKNTNSDIGISKFILNTDFTQADIFIVEMGAYNKGDIQLVCDIVHPSIGILTAINEQHLSLFGSIKNTQSAKYELLRALPKDGLAITNSDNPYCREFLDELSSEVVTFGTDAEYNPTCLIDGITSNQKGIYVKGVVDWKNVDKGRGIQTKLRGEHNILNLAPCILVATYLDFTSDEIILIAENIENPENLMSVYQYGKATIIDDSHNSNPDGFIAALQVLSRYPSEKKRIVITRGMLELGDMSFELHEKIGGEIAFVADELVIITPDFAEPLKRGVVKKYRTDILEKFSIDGLLDYVKSLKNINSVILLENKIPEAIKKEFHAAG